MYIVKKKTYNFSQPVTRLLACLYQEWCHIRSSVLVYVVGRYDTQNEDVIREGLESGSPCCQAHVYTSSTHYLFMGLLDSDRDVCDKKLTIHRMRH